MKLPRIPYAWIIFTPPALFALGFLLNAIVVAANGGQMPVHVPGGACRLISEDDIVHTCMTAASHLKILADWILINGSDPRIASPGDFLEWSLDQTMFPAFVAWVALIIKDHHDRTAK